MRVLATHGEGVGRGRKVISGGYRVACPARNHRIEVGAEQSYHSQGVPDGHVVGVHARDCQGYRVHFIDSRCQQPSQRLQLYNNRWLAIQELPSPSE